MRSIFNDPTLCTFVCVCIPEFLPVYETERLVTDLATHNIDSCNIVVNNVLFKENGATSPMCVARRRLQASDPALALDALSKIMQN